MGFWRKKYFQVFMDIMLALAIIIAFFASISIVLGVRYPLLVVVSESMVPTLNVGDIIVVKGASPSQISIGDIVVFRNPWRTNELIVHRVIDIYFDERGNCLITTLGDNTNPKTGRDQFSPWDASLLVGKVIMRVPYLGNLHLLTYHTWSALLFIAIIILLMLLISMMPSQRQSAEGGKHVGRRLIYIAAVNILVICLIIFSLWGYVNIPLNGKSVKILGMYEELKLGETMYGEGKAILRIGFMTYRIDCRINDDIRLGVTTLSWFQMLLSILIIFDIEELLGKKINEFLKRFILKKEGVNNKG